MPINRIGKSMTAAQITSGVPRAIDAGFGVIKFTRAKDPDLKTSKPGDVVCDSFLSMAIAVDKLQIEVDNSSRRDSHLVSYGGESFEVGKGVVHNLVASDFGRDMTDKYYDSKVYHALMRGALASIDEPVITTLVLGLPMNHFENKERIAKLCSEYTGPIELGSGKTVNILKTIVHPQPMGGYLSLGHEIDGINEALKSYPKCGIEPLKGPADLQNLNVLVVDPGEFTLDWLMMTPSGPAQRVSNAISDAGRHRVLRDVHKMLSAEINRPLGVSFYTAIDEALRTKKPIRIGGLAYRLDTKEYQAIIDKAVEDPVRQLLEGLRGADDRVDLVAVLGGSPIEIADAIRRARPNLPLFVPSELTGQRASMFANLRGFQEWAAVVDARTASETV